MLGLSHLRDRTELPDPPEGTPPAGRFHDPVDTGHRTNLLGPCIVWACRRCPVTLTRSEDAGPPRDWGPCEGADPPAGAQPPQERAASAGPWDPVDELFLTWGRRDARGVPFHPESAAEGLQVLAQSIHDVAARVAAKAHDAEDARALVRCARTLVGAGALLLEHAPKTEGR